ncbi:MAG: permease-like cell division protein FtsX [Candidatus Marinimicrobia bacterium]|jgi:cell division transport system permease protein|nr:ABC transporter permease [Candidatus Neomarinimicrobiota bacterium]MDP6034223.1 permease-like cell division protein FtsX [Candidatus Neomarinimicrobiota bacterium]MDP6201032.1 permease-like cell division protein FtsX [Candidatus Neomarinimicrobiota bacterium]MDP7329944.1 permease-like cell division protein FtsX [Candidatus Neomarinimicrobiota bacterium]|tara:strand:+ start:746 stop:1615 length:870 start_codon:yes stop_codon:yes gene_type:complete
MDKMMFLLSEGVKNLWRHKLTAFTAIFSTFLTLSVAGSLMIVGQNTNKVIEYLRGKYKIEVFFNENVPDKQIATVVEAFNKINGVRSTTLISRSDAGKIFKSQFGENILDIVGYNPLPVSCVVNVVTFQNDKMNVMPIVERIKSFPEVDEVLYQGRLIYRIETYYQKFVQVMTALLILVLVITVLIISNTVRLTIFAKHELIQALQLIGATRSFVKAPFVIEGVLHGLIGATLAAILLIAGVEVGSDLLYSVSKFKIQYSPFVLFGILSSLSIVISFLGSSRAISRFLK